MQRAAAAAPPTGQHLYAYCHVKTNQVLYSMSRNLNNSHLKQLPDVGANHTPPKLRKDLWRPLFAVSLPATEEGRIQKVDMMRRLREYRTLHELYWEPSEEMTRPISQKKIDEMDKKLQDRGGSKKETVYDLLAREKHKMRVKMVMDQKANSIADLAAAMLKQDEEGARVKEEEEKREAESRRRDAEEMILLASDKPGVQSMATLLLQEKQLREKIAQASDAKQIRDLHTSLNKLLLWIRRKEFAISQVEVAKQARDSGAAAEESENPAEATDVAADADRDSERTYLLEVLPAFPADMRYPTQRKTQKMEKLKRTRPVFNADNITVRWANTLDAEFAKSWPYGVQHEPLGITRYSHPKLPATEEEAFEPIVDVAEFKALGWKMRKENFELEPSIADRVIARRQEMGLEDDPVVANKLRVVTAESARKRKAKPEMEAAMRTVREEAEKVDERALTTDGEERSLTEEGLEDADAQLDELPGQPALSAEEQKAELLAKLHRRTMDRTREALAAQLKRRQERAERRRMELEAAAANAEKKRKRKEMQTQQGGVDPVAMAGVSKRVEEVRDI